MELRLSSKLGLTLPTEPGLARVRDSKLAEIGSTRLRLGRLASEASGVGVAQ
jgi:hypothetical protein